MELSNRNIAFGAIGTMTLLFGIYYYCYPKGSSPTEKANRIEEIES